MKRRWIVELCIAGLITTALVSCASIDGSQSGNMPGEHEGSSRDQVQLLEKPGAASNYFYQATCYTRDIPLLPGDEADRPPTDDHTFAFVFIGRLTADKCASTKITDRNSFYFGTALSDDVDQRIEELANAAHLVLLMSKSKMPLIKMCGPGEIAKSAGNVSLADLKMDSVIWRERSDDYMARMSTTTEATDSDHAGASIAIYFETKFAKGLKTETPFPVSNVSCQFDIGE